MFSRYTNRILLFQMLLHLRLLNKGLISIIALFSLLSCKCYITMPIQLYIQILYYMLSYMGMKLGVSL
jgi:hypothetical protein